VYHRGVTGCVSKCIEIVSNSVGKGFDSYLLLGDDLFLFRLHLHSLFQLNSSSSALASCKSFVSNPSVNQLYTSDNSL
jgi:hypothetical protein